MSDQLLRLEQGIRAAHEAGNAEHVKVLGAEYRRLQSEMSAPAPEPAPEQKAAPATGFGDALQFGWDNAGRNVGGGLESIGELLDWDAAKIVGNHQKTTNQREIDAANYSRPEGADGVLTNLMQGDLANAGKSLGYAAAESGPSIATGALASGAAVASGPVALGTAVLGTGATALQALGENRQEKVEKGLDPTATYTDLASAVASGAVELLPLGKAGGGFTLKFTKEGLQEAGQEGLVIGSTAVQGGEYVPEEIANRLGEAFVVGGAISKGMDATVNTAGKVAGAVVPSRTDNREFTGDEVAAAERIKRHADGSDKVLGNVNDDGAGTAKGAANAALREARAEAEALTADLKAVAKITDGAGDADVALKSLGKIKSHQGSTTSEHALDRVSTALPDNTDVARLRSVLKEIDAIQEFTKGSDNDMGGVSRLAKKLDPLDKRNNNAFGTHALLAGGLVRGSVASAMAIPIAINRASRVLDRLTNRRSRVKRFVDSAKKSGTAATQIDGPTSGDILTKLKTDQAAIKMADANAKVAKTAQSDAQKAHMAYEKAMGTNIPQGPVTPRRPADIARQAQMAQQAGIPSVREVTMKARAEKAALDQSNATSQDARGLKAQNQLATEQQRAQKLAMSQQALDKTQAAAQRQTEMNKVIYDEMFRTGKVPEGRAFKTYQLMEHATGMNPKKAAQTLDLLAQEGLIDPMIAEKFKTDPDWFANNPKDAYKAQELVRQAANPEYTAPPFVKDKAKAPVHPDEVLRKLEMAAARPTSSRRKQKAMEGDLRYKRILQEIAKAEGSLPTNQYKGLLQLVEEMNRPDSNITDRYTLISEGLDIIFDGNPAMKAFWDRKLAPLAAIGNDQRIHHAKVETDPVQDQMEVAFETKVKKAKKRKKKPELPKKPSQEVPITQEPDAPAVTPAEKALKKLNKPTPEPEPALDQSNATTTQDQQEPVKPVKTKARKTLKDRTDARIDDLHYMVYLAETEGDNLSQHIAKLGKGSVSRVEGLIYQFASDRVTVNQLVDAYSTEYGIPPQDAARIVNDALGVMELEGQLKRFTPKHSDRLIYDGKMVKTEDGKTVSVLQLQFMDGPLKDRVEVAKAVRWTEKMVPMDAPDKNFDPNYTQDGAFNAFKGIPSDRVDGTFMPLLNMLNSMRNSTMAVSSKMLTQIEDALGGTGAKRQGTINEVMTPKDKHGKPDESPMRTVAQLIFQLGPQDDRPSNLIRQEWMSGDNGRIYSKNSLAHSQAGDLMKGILRTNEKHPVGGEPGMKMLMHSIGNLLGFDKLAPSYRRSAIFDHNLVDGLVKLANDPFGRQTLKNERTGITPIGKMVKDGEGFFQVLNAAHEVKDMVDWARERHTDMDELSNSELLSHPDVVDDLGRNYTTDFVVQLDAKNNAYQNLGMMMGYDKVLRETGMLPMSPDNDPDSGEVADIYIKPAVGVAERIPELSELALPQGKLRKLFKGPIGTYLYAAAFNSRKKSFRDTLEDMTDGAELFGMDGEDAMINIDPALSAAMLSEEGHTFVDEHYDVNGDSKSTKATRKRVVEKGGKFQVQNAEGAAGAWSAGGMKFNSPQEAVKETYSTNLFARMSRELVREMNTLYPDVQKYLNYAEIVSKVVKDRGGADIIVPTADGIDLRYSFKQTPGFEAAPVTLGDGRVVDLGVRNADEKLAGRGLAAFMAHQMDAFVLRETHKRMGDMKSFNPIHDSFGFHPSDAQRGQETWVGVMQELGDANYNIFLNILEANGVTLEEFVGAGGDPSVILGRQGVAPVPAGQIPTALS